MPLTGNTFFFPWEADLMVWLQRTLPDSVISLISHVSFFGEEIFIVLVLGFVYWCWDKKAGIRIGLTMLMINIWTPMVKNVALRRRPYFDHEGIAIKRVVAPEADPMDISAQGFSFPSGHSANAAGLGASTATVFKQRWLTVLAVVIPLLVGVSRVVVGAHYPTDVMAGWLIGLLTLALVSFLDKKLPNRKVFYGVLLLTAIPGVFYCRSADYYTGFGLLIGFLAGSLVEEKYVRFENTRSPLRMVFRVLGGAALFLGLNSILKLPFSKDFLNSGTPAALWVRCARYALVAFLMFAVYPMIFRYTAKLGKR